MSLVRQPSHPTLVAIDVAIIDVAEYVSEHATGKAKLGWGYCQDAVKVGKALAELRGAVLMTLPQYLDATEPLCP